MLLCYLKITQNEKAFETLITLLKKLFAMTCKRFRGEFTSQYVVEIYFSTVCDILTSSVQYGITNDQNLKRERHSDVLGLS